MEEKPPQSSKAIGQTRLGPELPGDLVTTDTGALLSNGTGEKDFSIDECVIGLSKKLVGRASAVFGTWTSRNVFRRPSSWEALKAEEKKKRLEAGGGQASDKMRGTA